MIGNIYLVNVEKATEHVKLGVQRLEEADDVHRSSCSADGRKSDQVAEQHRHIVVVLSLNRFACDQQIIAMMLSM